jgi:sulfide:quinone oxidoreductase
MLGWRKPESIQRPLSLLAKFGIEIYCEFVTSIQPEKNLVSTEQRNFTYDYLVVALGAEYMLSAVPKLAEVSHTFYTLDGASRLYQAIRRFTGGKIAICVSSLPYKCPPAPYEGGLLLDSFFYRKGIKDCEISIFTPEGSPLTVAGESVSGEISAILKTRNIQFNGNKKLSSLESLERTLHFDDGFSHRFDLCIIVPPHRPVAVIRDCALASDGGWISVDPRTLKTSHDNVFAIGDTTALPIGENRYLPKAGTFAFHEAEVVANNIAVDILKTGDLKEFTGSGYCFLETGHGKAGYVQANFFDTTASPVIIQEPAVKHHWTKVVFEKYWFWRWF